MKIINTILVVIMLTASAFAQLPNKMTYQAVVRDASSTPVVTTQVGIEINIYQTTASGTLVYTETQTPTTNVNGLLSLEIGGQTGFDLIDWSNGPYFIETNIDLSGGTNYTITGVSQLLTVPYALHSKTAETITGGISETDPAFTSSQAYNITSTDIMNLSNLSNINTGDQDLSAYATQTALEDTASAIRADFPSGSQADGSETKITAGTNVTVTGIGTTAEPYVVNASSSYYVGQLLGTNGEDGVVFYVDHTGEHGLICSKNDLDGGSGVAWSAVNNTEIGVAAKSQFNGLGNTTAIIAQSGSSAAKLCADYSTAGASAGSWYLPSIDELSKVYQAKYEINKALNINSFALTFYCSSTEWSKSQAWSFFFNNGYISFTSKEFSSYRVRAVRVF